MNAVRLMLPWLLRHRRRLLVAAVVAVVTVFAGVGLFSVAGWFLTGAYLAGASIAFDLFAPSALVRGLSFLRIGSRYVERITGHAATFDLLADLRTAVFAAVMALDPAHLARYRDGDLVSRLIGDIDVLDTLFLLVIAPVFTALTAGAVFAALAGVYVPHLGVWFLAAVLAGVFAVPLGLARWSRKPGAQVRASAADTHALIHDTMAGHVDITVFGAQRRVADQCRVMTARLARSRDKVAAIGAWGQFAQQLVVGACVLAMLWFGLVAFKSGTLTGPVWAGIVLGGIGLLEVLSPLMRGAARLGATAEGARRVQAVLGRQPRAARHAGVDLPESGSLVFDDVSFRYGNGPLVLEHVNLAVAQGQRVAILGSSGSGKSTLLSLPLRIVDPAQGSVSYGMVDLSRANPEQLRRRVALLSQFSPVFMGTVRANLRIGDAQAGDAQLWHALEQAHLADFVRSLPEGLDAWVGESGRNLSVGQVRRLCLARTVLAPARVWVLDEPTAGLDEDTAQLFFRDLANVAGDRTVIMATHAGFPPGVFHRVLRLERGVLYDTARDGLHETTRGV